MRWEMRTSFLDPEISTVTDTFMPVCFGHTGGVRVVRMVTHGCSTEENLGCIVELFRPVKCARQMAISGVTLPAFMTIHLFQFHFGETKPYVLCPPETM